MTSRFLIVGAIIGFLWGCITGILDYPIFGWKWHLLIIAGNASYFLGSRVGK